MNKHTCLVFFNILKFIADMEFLANFTHMVFLGNMVYLSDILLGERKFKTDNICESVQRPCQVFRKKNLSH